MTHWVFLTIIIFLGVAPAHSSITCQEAIKIFRSQKLSCAPDPLLSRSDGHSDFLVVDEEDAEFPLKVIKFIPVDPSDSSRKDIEFGIQVLMGLKDEPFAARYFDAWDTKQGFFILMERLGGGSLREFLQMHPESMQNPYFLLRLLNQIARGIKAFWDRGFEMLTLDPNMISLDGGLRVRLSYLGQNCQSSHESRRQMQALVEEALDETRADSELSEQNSQAAEPGQWYRLPSLKLILDPLLVSKEEFGFPESSDLNPEEHLMNGFSWRSLWIPAGTELTIARALQLTIPEARRRPWLQDDLLIITEETLKLSDTRHYQLVEETFYDPLSPLGRGDFRLMKNPGGRCVGYWKGRFDQLADEIRKKEGDCRESVLSERRAKPGLLGTIFNSLSGFCRRKRHRQQNPSNPRLLSQATGLQPGPSVHNRLMIR